MFNRLVHAALITPSSPQTGLRASLRNIANIYEEIDWFPKWPGRIRDVRTEFSAKCRNLKDGDLLFMQLQTDGIISGDLLAQVKGFKCSWGGDLRAELPTWAKKLAPHVDLMLMSNQRDVDELRSLGHTADYLQIGVDPQRFSPEGALRDGTPEIIFCGNNYPDRFERSRYRAQMVVGLQMRYGSRFAPFGSGWGESDVWLNEGMESAAYRTCKIAVSAEHFFVPKFCSDRVMRATSSGAFLLADRFPGFEDHFIDGVEAVGWDDLDDLYRKIDYFLNHDDERKVIAAAGCARTRTTHSWDARIGNLQAIIEKYSAVPA